MRAYGSDAGLLFGWETAYGTPDFDTALKMPFTSNNVGSEQGLITSPVLGFGRDPSDPFLDVINVDGDIGVPIDPRYLGLWLTALFGPADTTPVAATGRITFGANPSVGQTITINGVTFTFDDDPSSGSNIEIKGSAVLTVTEIVSVLNASANASVDDATYSQPVGEAVLVITHDTAGPAGNAFTLAASHATRSGATLDGGCFEHLFASGETDLPSFWLEGQNPKVPAFFLHTGVKLNSIGLNFARSGAALATLNAIAQSETRNNVTVAASPDELDLTMISQFRGSLRSGGELLGNVTAATVSYSNNMERIETIRDDGKIDGADPTVASLTGSFDMRFADTDFIDLASSGTPVDLEFAYRLGAGSSIVIEAPRVYLPKSKIGVSGPGGVPVSFSYQGARDSVAEKMALVRLRNDVAGAVYALPEA